MKSAPVMAVVTGVGFLLAAACSPSFNPGTGDMVRPQTPQNPVPTTQSINDSLHRILTFLDRAMPMRVIPDSTVQMQSRPLTRPLDEPDWAEYSSRCPEITDFSSPWPYATVDTGYAGNFSPLHYCSGVTYAGMLSAADATGDPAFLKFVARRLQFIHDRLPYFQAQAKQFGMEHNSFVTIFKPESLDAAGAMCAAMIKAQNAGVGPDMSHVIQPWIDFIENDQYRLPDGTFARKIPFLQSVWADDTYMSVPALAQMGHLTGYPQYMNDAANQVLQFSGYLFNESAGLYQHGHNGPVSVHWARANGWAIMATEELLDVLPPDHPQRGKILELLQAHLQGIASLQASDGLWHQVLDHADSYTETSASAMFVYAIAHAINKQWVSPVGYGPIAQTGWNALARRIDEQGRVHGTCISTPMGSDLPYYYNRPTSPYAPHGYGPMLLAGAEMIRLLQNPDIEIKAMDGDVVYSTKSK